VAVGRSASNRSRQDHHRLRDHGRYAGRPAWIRKRSAVELTGARRFVGRARAGRCTCSTYDGEAAHENAKSVSR
jgi:hypothetical protein